MPSVEELLEASGLPLAEGRILIAHALGLDRATLAAHPEREVGSERETIESLFARRRAGEPVAYLTGEREFYGLAFKVSPAVLIPRPETELLLEVALRHARGGARVLDLGTGSGALAVALALQRPGVSVTACDASEAALAVARANAERHRASVRFVASDWFSALEYQRFDLILANPPYIASGDSHLDQGDLRFEPRRALEAGPTGLEQIAAIAGASRDHLEPRGWLVIEHGYDQAEQCERLLTQSGFSRVSDALDLAGLPRVVCGRFDPDGGER